MNGKKCNFFYLFGRINKAKTKSHSDVAKFEKGFFHKVLFDYHE